MKTIEVPDDHLIGMRVPRGGSSCAKCRYLRPPGQCENRLWVKWHQGNAVIPAPVNEYCCDFFEASTRS